MNTRLLALFSSLIAVFGIALVTPLARGQDRNFAGSVQGSYLYVRAKDGPTNKRVLDGFVTEVSAKLAVDFNEHISTNVKLCFGCHGFEVGMAFVDLTVVDELRFRVGRFNPSFGEFALRHDPANHRTVDKPLPYDMGRMVRYNDYGLGVLPAPYVDNGIEVGGTHWFGYTLQMDYAAYAVGGLRGDNNDINFKQSRMGSYYIDNNSRPSGGGRFALTLDLPDAESTFTLGGSGMAGFYDPQGKLLYWVGGADLYGRIKSFELRAEYLMRRTEMDINSHNASQYKYGPKKNGKYDRFYLKDGFYVEALIPVTDRIELVGRWDGLRRFGNVPKVGQSSSLRKNSTVYRYTFGTDISVSHGVRVKLDLEYYDFNDFHDEIAATMAVVAVL